MVMCIYIYIVHAFPEDSLTWLRQKSNSKELAGLYVIGGKDESMPP